MTAEQFENFQKIFANMSEKCGKDMSEDEFLSLLDQACEEYYCIMQYNLAFDLFIKDNPVLGMLYNALGIKGESPNYVNRVVQFTQTLTKLHVNTSEEIKAFLPALTVQIPCILNEALDKGRKGAEIIDEYLLRTGNASIVEEVVFDIKSHSQDFTKPKNLEDALNEKIKE